MKHIIWNNVDLLEDEYIYKVDESRQVAFFSKLNKNGSIPVKFGEWGNRRYYGQNTSNEPQLPIYIITEEFREGWKLVDWRFGESQNWAILMHPYGFKLEVHIKSLTDIINNTTIINGVLQGKFKWSYSKLIKE